MKLFKCESESSSVLEFIIAVVANETCTEVNSVG